MNLTLTVPNSTRSLSTKNAPWLRLLLLSPSACRHPGVGSKGAAGLRRGEQRGVAVRSQAPALPSERPCIAGHPVQQTGG